MLWLRLPLLLLLGLGTAGTGVCQTDDAPVRTVALTRTLTIPMTRVEQAGTVTASRQAAAPLGVWPGNADEPPEGPTGFDVFDDGSLLIADPLLKRLGLYDAQGRYQRAWQIGFAADSIRMADGGEVLVREATTGEFHRFDREGRPLAGTAPQPQAGPAVHMLPGGNRAMVDSSPAVTVTYTGSGSLLSVEALSAASNEGLFLAMEATASGGEPGAVDVRKFVRRYSSAGRPVAETESMPLNYYVLPVDELRVRKGVVYQLMTTGSEVRIHEWDTNAR